MKQIQHTKSVRLHMKAPYCNVNVRYKPLKTWTETTEYTPNNLEGENVPFFMVHNKARKDQQTT